MILTLVGSVALAVFCFANDIVLAEQNLVPKPGSGNFQSYNPSCAVNSRYVKTCSSAPLRAWLRV